MTTLGQLDLASGSVAVRAMDARALVVRLLRKSGTPPKHAQVVADHLIESSQLGVHSHGLIRVPQYVHEIMAGDIDPVVKPERAARRSATMWVTGNGGFGQVTAQYATHQAQALAARYGVGLVVANHLGHSGRLGAYAEKLAANGYLGAIFGSGPPSGHLVAPFGGVEGRLATNPIAFAIPNGKEPVVADFSTSAMPEGRVRSLRNLGNLLPEGVLQDAAGNATNDPSVLYGHPRGTLLPLGGRTFGHKGYALGLFVEAMATLLAGDQTDDRSRVGGNLTVLAIATQPGFADRTRRMVEYLRSAVPFHPDRPVLVPGDPERLAHEASSVSMDKQTWREIRALARDLSVRLPTEI